MIISEGVYNFINKCAKLSSASQRFVQGAFAFPLQIGLDLYASSADKETRETSACKTGSKIAACTAVGVAVRLLFGFLVRRNCNYNKLIFDSFGRVCGVEGAKIKKFFMPNLEKLKKKCTKSEFETHLNTYITATGTLCASAAMCFTNVFIDAPLTVFLTNRVMDLKDKIKGVKNEKSS